eukprot:2903893-Rhodomonas_salina.1
MGEWERRAPLHAGPGTARLPRSRLRPGTRPTRPGPVPVPLSLVWEVRARDHRGGRAEVEKVCRIAGGPGAARERVGKTRRREERRGGGVSEGEGLVGEGERRYLSGGKRARGQTRVRVGCQAAAIILFCCASCCEVANVSAPGGSVAA